MKKGTGRGDSVAEDDNLDSAETKDGDSARIGKTSLAPTCIMKFTRTSGEDKVKLGLKKFRMKKLHEIDDKRKQVLIRILRNILLKVTELVLPNDSKKLLSAAVEAAGVANHQDDIFVKDLRCVRKSCLEKRLLRCVAVSNMRRENSLRGNRSDVQELERENNQRTEPSRESGVAADDGESGSKEFSGNVRRL